jgi:hypothetical protein
MIIVIISKINAKRSKANRICDTWHYAVRAKKKKKKKKNKNKKQNKER